MEVDAVADSGSEGEFCETIIIIMICETVCFSSDIQIYLENLLVFPSSVKII